MLSTIKRRGDVSGYGRKVPAEGSLSVNPGDSGRMTNGAQLDALKAELLELNKQIEIAERAPIDPAVLTAAIEQAERDRDAVTSPAVEDLRETVEKLADDIETDWIGNVHVLWNVEKLSRSNLRDKLAVPIHLRATLTELVDVRDRIGRRLADADVDYVTLPVLPECPSLPEGPDNGSR
jgi:hypothetical protein